MNPAFALRQNSKRYRPRTRNSGSNSKVFQANRKISLKHELVAGKIDCAWSWIMRANQRAEMVPRLSTFLASAYRFRGMPDLTARIASVNGKTERDSGATPSQPVACPHQISVSQALSRLAFRVQGWT
jgi:hypothetical protein